MKTHLQRTVLLLCLLLPAAGISNHFISEPTTGTPKVGDILVVKDPAGANFEYIRFPKPNIILKRTGVYNLASVRDMQVEITKIEEKKEGLLVVTLRPLEGKKFFRHWRSVEAEYDQALASGELKQK